MFLLHAAHCLRGTASKLGKFGIHLQICRGIRNSLDLLNLLFALLVAGGFFLLLNLPRLCLLLVCQRRVSCLQSKRTFHIGAKAKPQNDIVAQLNTIILLLISGIKSRQLIRPLFVEIFPFVCFQYLYLFCHRGVLRAGHLVQQDISSLIMRRNAAELIEILVCIFVIVRFQCQFRKSVHNTPNRCVLIRLNQRVHCVLIPTVRCINIGNCRQHLYIPYLIPVDRITQSGCFFIILSCGHLSDMLCL